MASAPVRIQWQTFCALSVAVAVAAAGELTEEDAI
jgi:hypothetical protein